MLWFRKLHCGNKSIFYYYMVLVLEKHRLQLDQFTLKNMIDIKISSCIIRLNNVVDLLLLYLFLSSVFQRVWMGCNSEGGLYSAQNLTQKVMLTIRSDGFVYFLGRKRSGPLNNSYDSHTLWYQLKETTKESITLILMTIKPTELI